MYVILPLCICFLAWLLFMTWASDWCTTFYGALHATSSYHLHSTFKLFHQQDKLRTLIQCSFWLLTSLISLTIHFTASHNHLYRHRSQRHWHPLILCCFFLLKWFFFDQKIYKFCGSILKLWCVNNGAYRRAILWWALLLT